jgi:hypothetical protein
MSVRITNGLEASMTTQRHENGLTLEVAAAGILAGFAMIVMEYVPSAAVPRWKRSRHGKSSKNTTPGVGRGGSTGCSGYKTTP